MRGLLSIALALAGVLAHPSQIQKTQSPAAGSYPVKLSVESAFVLPEPEIRPNLLATSGFENYYRVYDPITGALQEEFSIHTIDGGFVTEDGALGRRMAYGNGTLDGRANWVCEWIFGCVDTAIDQFTISTAAATAAATALGNDLRANGYQKAKQIIVSAIYQHAIGITSGIISWYITNKIQGQDPQGMDNCQSLNVNNLENMIAQLQADIQDLKTHIQAADSRPRGYDHYSFETTQQQEGGHLKHTTKPTYDPNDYKTISDCNIT